MLLGQRGSDVHLSCDIEHAAAKDKAQCWLCVKSLQTRLTIRLGRKGVRLRVLMGTVCSFSFSAPSLITPAVRSCRGAYEKRN